MESPSSGFGKLSLSTKGVLVVAVPVLALAVTMGVFSELESRMRSAQAGVAHTVSVRGEIRAVMLEMSDAESAVRGYLLTRRRELLAPYTAALSDVPVRLGRLESLVRDNQAQTAQLARVRREVPAVFQQFETLVDSPRLSMVQIHSAEEAANALSPTLSGMLAEEERLLASRTAAADRANRRLRAAVYAGGAIGLLGGLLAALAFTAGIVRRVRELERGARLVAAGERFTTDAKGDDEIARLHRTLKASSERLTEQGEELRAAQQELERRVAERTSELQKANEALRESNQVRQGLIEYSPLAIWAMDLEGRVLFWNPAAERIFGWNQEEVLGRQIPIVPAELRDEYAGWLTRFQEGESWSGREAERIRKDGTKLDVAIWTSPLRDAAGRINGTIVIDSDVTERKLLEEQFRQSQKLEAVGRLAGGVAHDFNNLLTVISGYTEMIMEEAGDEGEIGEYAEEIQYAATRSGALTAQLLAFSRRQITQPQVLNLNGVVEHSTRLLRRVIGEDIEIETHLDPKLDRTKVDPTHIDQVIMNLVVNARDAMSEGGRLTIETGNVVLDESYAGRHIGVKPGRYVMLAVSDTGHGMTEEVRSRLFEPFYTTKPAGKGTGLGLSIVYGVVKQNRGDIMVYSEPGKGTTLKIYFPAVEEASEVGEAGAEPDELHGTETVLVCEDEARIRKLVAAVLAKLGYRVLEAGTPEQALEFARDAGSEIDLLLTDIVMPHGNGFELAKEILAMRPAIKVLYMSGYTDTHLSGTWVLEPDTPFLQKPFAAAVLAKKVRQTLGHGAQAG